MVFYLVFLDIVAELFPEDESGSSRPLRLRFKARSTSPLTHSNNQRKPQASLDSGGGERDCASYWDEQQSICGHLETPDRLQ